MPTTLIPPVEAPAPLQPRRWAVTDLATSTAVLRSSRGVVADLDIVGTARAVGVALDVVQRVFDSYCDAAGGADAGFGMCSVPARDIAADAHCSVHATNRAVRVLCTFGLIRRRARRWGPWATVVPVVLALAAAEPGTLEELWSLPPRGEPWPLPAATAKAAQSAALRCQPPDAVARPPDGSSCPCPAPRCDLGWVTEHLAAVIGPQARNGSWQDWLHDALRLGYTPPQLLHELVRDLETARVPVKVIRSRLGVITGRGRWADHECGHTANNAPQRPQEPPERAQPPDAAPPPDRPETPDTRAVRASRDETRATDRKDLSNPLPPAPLASRHRGERIQQPSNPSRVLQQAAGIVGVSFPPEETAELASQLLSDGLDDPHRVLLGLVAETATADNPAGLLRWRVMNRARAERKAAKYLAAAQDWGPDAIREPAAAKALALIRSSVADDSARRRRSRLDAADRQRDRIQTLDLAAARRIEQRATAAVQRAESMLGRSLSVDERRVVAHLALGAVPLAPRRAVRMLASSGPDAALALVAAARATGSEHLLAAHEMPASTRQRLESASAALPPAPDSPELPYE